MNRIEDFALIGDCHSSALVGRDGSIDWACFPRFDSPSVFCRILDEERGGSFVLRGADAHETSRRYEEDTNVVVTTFVTPTGVCEITDCMPVIDTGSHIPGTRHSILRRARCTDGTVDIELTFTPRFEYASFTPQIRMIGTRAAEAVGGANALTLHATHPLAAAAGDMISALWPLRAGEEAWCELAWRPSYDPRPDGLTKPMRKRRARITLDETIRFWRRWAAESWYEGDHRTAVRRSALALKAMTYAPSGAVVAAPTTSLPEEIGGERNWDYRFTWIRDATLTLTSLLILGFREEADAFKRWLERAGGAGHPDQLQIMFGIGGERQLVETELDHLAGHRGSTPVRIGNGAYSQIQLDTYGQILEAAFLYGKVGGTYTSEQWRWLRALANVACARWRDPDQGIWEIRDEPRHFTHSKLNCWVAIDRALRIANANGFDAPAERWMREREAIREWLMTQAAPDGWFQQAAGFPVPDAATLLIPALGFLPTSHPVVMRTIEMVRAKLADDGLVYRYRNDDGLEGGEGAFLICSFWLLDCLIHAGMIDQADALLDRLLPLANDVGLYAEQADPHSGEALGNFPQAFSHMALVQSCGHLTAAKQGAIPMDRAVDYAELAVDRLLARPR